MLGDIRQAKKVLHRLRVYRYAERVDSLVPFIQQHFKLDPYASSLFLFCGKRCDRLKALLWEPDGLFCCTKDWTMAGTSAAECAGGQAADLGAVHLAHAGIEY